MTKDIRHNRTDLKLGKLGDDILEHLLAYPLVTGTLVNIDGNFTGMAISCPTIKRL